MKILRSVFIGVVLLCIWQSVVVYFEIPDYLLPSPWQSLTALFEYRTSILSQALTTCLETLLGFSFGLIFGCLAGLMIAFFRPLKLWFFPLLIISQAIPTFAIAPLLVVWLGYGLAAKIVTTMIMIFFPITSAFYDGLISVNQAWLDLAKTMHASKWRIFWHIRIPAALPALASGMRVAAVIAPIGAIVGEWVGASRGLGYLMLNANARLQIDVMFAALLVIILLSLTLYFSIDIILRRSIWWKP